MKRVLLALFLVGVFLIPAVSYSAKEPVLLLSFDEISNVIVKDISKFGNNGTMEGNPTVVNGKFGKALQFENNRVKVLTSASLSSELFKNGNFTVVLWINPKRTGNAWQQVFRGGPDPNDTLFLNINGTLSWRGWVGAAWAGGMCETAADAVPANSWSHVAILGNTKNFRVYVNGKVAKESAFQATRGNNKEFMIGGYAGGESYSGAVDDFAIFAEPLDDATINSIMNQGLKSSLTSVEPGSKISIKWGEVKNSL